MKNWILLSLLLVVGCTHHKPPRRLTRLYAARCVVESKTQIESIYTINFRVLGTTFPSDGLIFQQGFQFSLPVDEDTWHYNVKGNGIYILYAMYSDYTWKILQEDPYILKHISGDQQ